jgi:hypothetical protein
VKEFNIDGAVDGEPIETLYHGRWFPVRFIGMVSGGRVAAEWVSGETMFIATPEYFRMAPQKKGTWYCRHHLYEGRPSLYKSLAPIAESVSLTWLGLPFTLEV